jgi:ribosomal protein L12E/L44/L45/RPP1/RPP2
MVKSSVSIPSKWEQYLKRLAEDHQVGLDKVMNELCTWAFSNSEIKKQFELWVDAAFPPPGEAEDKARAAGAIERAREEEAEEALEEEAHEDRDYSEDREIAP